MRGLSSSDRGGIAHEMVWRKMPNRALRIGMTGANERRKRKVPHFQHSHFWQDLARRGAKLVAQVRVGIGCLPTSFVYAMIFMSSEESRRSSFGGES